VNESLFHAETQMLEHRKELLPGSAAVYKPLDTAEDVNEAVTYRGMGVSGSHQ